jgi:dihydroflavonol-4-reductase
MANVLRAAIPERSSKMPRFEVPDWVVRLFAFVDRDMRGNVGELGVIKRVDPRDVVALLGRPLISAEDAIVASARSLIAEGIA